MEQSDLDLLQTVPSYHLQSITRVRLGPLSPKTLPSEPSSSAFPSSVPTAIAEIAQILFDASTLSKVLGELGGVEKALMHELVACGGRANSRDLALYFSSGDLLTPAKKSDVPLEMAFEVPRGYPPGMALQYPVAHPHGVFEHALHHLLALGLLFWGKQTNFAGRDYSSGIHDGVLIVPLAVRDVALREWKLDYFRVGESGENGDDVGDGARAFQRTLYLYWSMVASMREGLSVVSNGLLSRSSLRHVVEHMGSRLHAEQARMENDAPSLLFVRLLLMELGLLQERRNALHAAPAEAYFSLPLLERVRRCYHLYSDTPFWNEILYLPDVNVRPGPASLDPAHDEVMRTRQVIIERLLHEKAGAWCNITALIARTKLYAPYLLFPRQYGPRAERYSSASNPYGWDFRLRRGWLTHREGWHMVEGGFIRAVVGGPLSWLGIVDLNSAENPSSFRLSPSAALIFDTTPIASEEVSWGRLIVQPNFELVALAPVSERLLVTLDRFADRVSLEHIAQYRLTKASVTRAIQRGMHAEALQEALEKAAGGEIPQNVRYSLTEWERQARRVEIWPEATLLEVDDVALLDTLFATEETRALFGRRLAPRLAEVAPHKLSMVQDVLWQQNYLPASTVVPTQDAALENGRLVMRESQWRLHDDGLLQPFYSVLDLYLVAEVERFSERDDTTGWHRITPTSLRRALEDGMALEHIVRFLQQYCEDGVPGSFLIRLKLWGNGYGEAHGPQTLYVESAPLLRLPSAILQDLQGDEEIKLLLGSVLEPQSRLVHVDAENLERIVALLRERGFAVD